MTSWGTVIVCRRLQPGALLMEWSCRSWWQEVQEGWVCVICFCVRVCVPPSSLILSLRYLPKIRPFVLYSYFHETWLRSLSQSLHFSDCLCPPWRTCPFSRLFVNAAVPFGSSWALILSLEIAQLVQWPDYGQDDRGFDSRQTQDICLCRNVRKPLEPIQPSIQWISGIIFHGVKSAGAWSWPVLRLGASATVRLSSASRLTFRHRNFLLNFSTSCI